jgi:hypothetical protein
MISFNGLFASDATGREAKPKGIGTATGAARPRSHFPMLPESGWLGGGVGSDDRWTGGRGPRLTPVLSALAVCEARQDL